ncbi:MAG: alpha/beta hydrolase [Caldilineaceae bacterium]|nr:alpha/beta hydrolase [Caldilineaceae bacterium]
MNSVQTARLTFNIRTSGSTDGVPLLLLHGSHATSRWWEPFFSILPDSIYAIAPDLRGCGQSTHSQDGYEIEDQAEDIAELIQSLALTDFDLVGHGSGGAIAIEYALRYSQRLRSLILVDSVPIEGAFTPLQGLQLLSQMREDRPMLQKALSTLFPSAPPPTMSEKEFESFFERLVDDAASMAPAAYTAVAEALGRWNRLEEAHRLTLPTLLLLGTEDVIIERDAATRSLLAIPGASNLEILRGVGHSPMVESPVVLAERIIDFITEDFDSFEEARGFAHDIAESSDKP